MTKRTALQRLFTLAIDRFGMIAGGEKILVAVSGGPDSVALLDLLQAEAPARGFELAVAHLDHGLRGSASTGDRRFVEGMAAAMGLVFFSGEADVREIARRERRSIEDAGRAARRRFLESTAASWGATHIATGHHADDRIEGLLMRLVEGTGVSGLGGLRSVSGRYVRPLILARRADIADHLRERGLPFRRDESNDDPSFLRNRIRMRLIPHLEQEFNPRVREALDRAAAILGEEDDLLSALASERSDEWASPENPRGSSSLPIAGLTGLPRALARRIVRSTILRAGVSPRRVRFDQIETILDLVGTRASGAGVTLAEGWCARIDDDRLLIDREEENDPGEGKGPADPGAVSERLAVPGETVLPGNGNRSGIGFECRLIPRADLHEPLSAGSGSVAHLDFDRTGRDLGVRRRRAGDRFHPLGAPGSRPLGDFLIDLKVPRRKRDRLLLVTSRPGRPAGRAAGEDSGVAEASAAEDRDEQIVWVTGLRVSERFRVMPETGLVLRIETVPAGAGSGAVSTREPL